MKSIKDINISGKKVFIRVDFNVPMDDKCDIIDDIRIRAGVDTINYAIENNAKIILASHLGRPKGKKDSKFSLLPISKRLSEILQKDVKMAPDCIGQEVEKMVSQMHEKDIILLENLRFYNEEQANDDNFATQLANLCDVYVNNAFAVSHRAHASVNKITKHAPISVAGLLLQKEIDYFEKAMNDPKRPLVAIIGGAKISSKLAALNNMLSKVDKIIIGGAMANTFLRANGVDVGISKVEEDLFDTAKNILDYAKLNNIEIFIPVDAVVAKKLDENEDSKVVSIDKIPSDQMVLDIGPSTIELYTNALADAKTIIWNGPMGVFEIDKFSMGTINLVNYVADSDALTIVGGGDTDVAVHKAGKVDKMSYISTGGGAFLSLMEGKSLPGVACLK